MKHSLHPKLCEYLFEVENVLLTVSRAVGNDPGMSDITTIRTCGKESKGDPQLTGRVFTTMILIHERTGKFHT